MKELKSSHCPNRGWMLPWLRLSRHREFASIAVSFRLLSSPLRLAPVCFLNPCSVDARAVTFPPTPSWLCQSPETICVLTAFVRRSVLSSLDSEVLWPMSESPVLSLVPKHWIEDHRLSEGFPPPLPCPVGFRYIHGLPWDVERGHSVSLLKIRRCQGCPHERPPFPLFSAARKMTTAASLFVLVQRIICTHFQAFELFHEECKYPKGRGCSFLAL